MKESSSFGSTLILRSDNMSQSDNDMKSYSRYPTSKIRIEHKIFHKNNNNKVTLGNNSVD